MRLKVVLLVLKLKDLKIYDIFHAKLNAVESLQTLAQDLFHNCKKPHIISQTTGGQTAKVDLQWLLPFMKTRCLIYPSKTCLSIDE